MKDQPERSWTTGDYLTHRFNPELGIGRVTALEGRALVVEFPRSGTTLRLAANTDALIPVDLSPGRPVRITATREETTIAARLPDGTLRLANGRTASSHELWPLELEGALLERLALGDLDEVEDFVTRLDILHLLTLREADGLGSFLGGRVRLFPHQLHVAERASASDPVRWLLADEVGLGKTIEAALILNRLVHAGKVERCLVVAPDALTVQWLGELWRKYHQVFTLLDAQRLADVARDFGPDFNPFDVHRRAVIALEMLTERPQLTDQAVAAGIDLLVVDEAQRLRRPPGHPGEPGWRAIAPIAGLGRHVLLLSATPLEDDAHGFFRLLQLLRPEEFPEDVSFEARLALGTPLPPCTSSTRRADIGGLPPRVGIPIALDNPASWQLQGRGRGGRARRGGAPCGRAAAEDRSRPSRAGVRSRARPPCSDPTNARCASRRRRWTPATRASTGCCRRRPAGATRGRRRSSSWRTARRWRCCARRSATGRSSRAASSTRSCPRRAATRKSPGSGSPMVQACSCPRNAEARVATSSSAAASCCSTCPGNHRSWNNGSAGSIGSAGASRWRSCTSVRPAGSARMSCGSSRRSVSSASRWPGWSRNWPTSRVRSRRSRSIRWRRSPENASTALVSEAHAARTRIREAAYQQLHRDPYRSEMAAGILARVPAELDALNEEVVVTACIGLGFTIERPRGRRIFAIELGNGALVDGLPGVPGGSSYVGSFDREEAVEDETIDFFASGHPLVEGIFAHFEESALGRVARFEVEIGEERGEGLVAVYKDGPVFEVVAIDSAGQTRPDWAAAFRQRPLRARPVSDEPVADRDWTGMVRRLGARLDPARRPHALAAIVVGPSTAGNVTP